MALQEKIAKLTPEQWEKLDAVKDETALDAFVSEHGIELTAEERGQILEYFKTGVLPLADEELDNVAGGGCRTQHWECHYCGASGKYEVPRGQPGLWSCPYCGRKFWY